MDINKYQFLAIKVEGDSEMTPRQALNSVPYALNVADNAVVTTKINDGAVTNSKLGDHAVTAVKIENGAVITDKIADNAVTTAKIADGTISQADLAINAVMPVGIIMGWIDYPGVPLPSNWIRCDGQVINDAQSPLNNLNAPNLNAGKRFIRGGSSAYNGGNFFMQDDAFQGHYHAGGLTVGTTGSTNVYDWNGPGHLNTVPVGAPVTDGTNGTPRVANETRPINMTVIWIMKIK